jgi:oligosaccharide amylase
MVFLPTSAVGNGRTICTLGRAGEIMTFFYPRLDFAQNIEECLPLLYVGEPGHGRLLWSFDPAFSTHQHYRGDSNIHVTELRLSDPALTITFTDFCPLESASLVRLIAVTNDGPNHFHGSVGHYFDLRLGEVYGKQAAGHDAAGGYFLQYFRGIAMAVGGTPPEVWRVGKSLAYDERSAKFDLQDGHLNGQAEDIGRVNFAGLRHLELAPGARDDSWLILCAGASREDAVAELRRLKDLGSDKLLQATADYWDYWLSRRVPLELPDEFEQAYRRALLSLALLQDESTGSIIAAPEFDPGYERCGGYGYCWPRDASEAAEALAQAGYPDALRRLCDWYKQAQLPDGMWGQRHWADGQVAPSWALRKGFEQLDQTAAAAVSLGNFILIADDNQRRLRLVDYWDSLQRAIVALGAHVDERGLHRLACDLWETYCGVFVYTNAAFARAFAVAQECARLSGRVALADEWLQIAQRLAEACNNLYNGVYFPRGLGSSGELDAAVDTSTFGLLEPWRILSPNDPQERRMIISNLREIQRRLSQPLDGHTGLRRFEGDVYLNGVVGCVNTLWGAQTCLQLAAAEQADSPDEARAFREQALDYLRLCLARATPTGLLPELIGLQPDTPYWAVPHAWASALMVRCVHLLHETRALGRDT